MVIIFKIACFLIIAATSLLLYTLYKDWKAVVVSVDYESNTTPMERFQYNSIFAFISACLLFVLILFGYLILCKVAISAPFS